MASLPGSGWKSQMGGCNYKSKGGKIQITGTAKGKGTPGALPSGGGKKVGQSFYEGLGAGRGIPAKGGKGKGSKWAASHDDSTE